MATKGNYIILLMLLRWGDLKKNLLCCLIQFLTLLFQTVIYKIEDLKTNYYYFRIWLKLFSEYNFLIFILRTFDFLSAVIFITYQQVVQLFFIKFSIDFLNFIYDMQNNLAKYL